MADHDLKQWMRKQNIYDNDIFAILSEQGVEDPQEDFKEYLQHQWDELWRRAVVARAKELKDQQAKVRLEAKMKKIEKHWRKESGIVVTSIKKGGKKKKSKAAPDESSKSQNNEALANGKAIKKYLQKNGCFMTDLLIILVKAEITCEEEIENIESNSQFDEIYRQLRVARTKDLKSNEARIRMEKSMTKFEKLWRAKTGVKKTSISKKKKKGSKKKDPKTVQNEQMATSGLGLKKWMRKNDIWEVALYNELLANDIEDHEQLIDITENTFDNIVRKVRVDRFAQLKDQKSRGRADKLLVRFEKLWRKASGKKKTSIK